MVTARRAGIVALAVALLAVGACNALLGNDSPTIGDDGAADGATPVGDGSQSSVDGGGDALSAGDASPAADASDAGVDGPSTGVDASDAALPPCMGVVCFLAAEQPGPYEIAVDDSYVYFTNQGTTPALDGGGGADGGGSIVRVQLDGGEVTALVGGLHAPRDILLDTSSVYWVSHDSPDDGGGAGCIGSVATTGGAPSFPVEPIFDDVAGLAMYEGNLVWGQPNEGIVGENLPSPNGPIHMVSGAYDIGGLVADSTGVYVTSGDYGSSGVVAAIVQTITIGGAGLDTRSTTLYDESQSPLRFGGAALGGGLLYFLETADGYVESIQEGPSVPSILATGQSSAVDIAYDQATGYVYWTSEGTAANGYTDGSVMKVLGVPDAGAPVPLASNQPRPHGIAVDAARVYWTNLGDGSVRVTPK